MNLTDFFLSSNHTERSFNYNKMEARIDQEAAAPLVSKEKEEEHLKIS